MQNVAAVSHIMCAHVGGAKIYGRCMGPGPFGLGMATPRNTPLPDIYYHAKIGRSTSNGDSPE